MFARIDKLERRRGRYDCCWLIWARTNSNYSFSYTVYIIDKDKLTELPQDKVKYNYYLPVFLRVCMLNVAKDISPM